MAIRATSSAVAQSSSVLVSPQTWFDVRPKIADCGLEWFACVDRVQELLPHLDGEPRLRLASEARPGGVVLRFPASITIAALSPPDQGAVGGLRATSSTIGIGQLPDFLQLLQRPRRLRNQSKGEPPPNDRRRHITCCCRLADRVISSGRPTRRTLAVLHRSWRDLRTGSSAASSISVQLIHRPQDGKFREDFATNRIIATRPRITASGPSRRSRWAYLPPPPARKPVCPLQESPGWDPSWAKMSRSAFGIWPQDWVRPGSKPEFGSFGSRNRSGFCPENAQIDFACGRSDLIGPDRQATARPCLTSSHAHSHPAMNGGPTATA
jgi:hypothetical protein